MKDYELYLEGPLNFVTFDSKGQVDVISEIYPEYDQDMTYRTTINGQNYIVCDHAKIDRPYLKYEGPFMTKIKQRSSERV
jgi:hypothetical protein